MELKMKLMNIIEKQWKLILGAFLLFVVAGLGVSFLSFQKTKKEQIAQEKYFLTEKKFLELKNKKNAPADEKTKTPAVNTDAEMAQLKTEFEKVIADYPGSKAAQMSAVYESDILVTMKDKAQALAVLKKVESNDAGLVNTLVQQQIGLLLADQGQCPEAILLWQKILDRKQASFIHNEAKMQQALCYHKMNDSKKAEEILTNLANQKPDAGLETSAISKEAEKYLRLIQFKKASGT